MKLTYEGVYTTKGEKLFLTFEEFKTFMKKEDRKGWFENWAGWDEHANLRDVYERNVLGHYYEFDANTKREYMVDSMYKLLHKSCTTGGGRSIIFAIPSFSNSRKSRMSNMAKMNEAPSSKRNGMPRLC